MRSWKPQCRAQSAQSRAEPSPGPDELAAEFYQTSKKDHIPTVLDLFHISEDEGVPPNSFYEFNITLVPEPGKDTRTRRKLLTSFFNEDAKIASQILANGIQNTLRRL